MRKFFGLIVWFYNSFSFEFEYRPMLNACWDIPTLAVHSLFQHMVNQITRSLVSSRRSTSCFSLFFGVAVRLYETTPFLSICWKWFTRIWSLQIIKDAMCPFSLYRPKASVMAGFIFISMVSCCSMYLRWIRMFVPIDVNLAIKKFCTPIVVVSAE